MKKLFILAFVLLTAFSFQAKAQNEFKSSARALGLRLGAGLSVTYQHQLTQKNMLSVDVDSPLFRGLDAAITYDWLNPFNANFNWNKRGSWNWYLGAGLCGGLETNCGFLGVTGRIGVEYNFWFPLQLALEWRPSAGPRFSPDGAFFNVPGVWNGAGLSIRYRF